MAEFRYETERMILRDWRDEDWPEFWRKTNTPAVMEWLGGVMDDATNKAAQQRVIDYGLQHGHTFWALECRETSAILGFCGLKRCNDKDGPLGDMEIGWRLAEEHWGKGYAREAAEASLRIGFEQFAAPLIIALTVLENTPSWGLMKRLGMSRREDLDFESTMFGIESIIVYSINRDECRFGGHEIFSICTDTFPK